MVFWNHGTLIVSVVSLQKLLYKFRDWITFMRGFCKKNKKKLISAGNKFADYTAS